VTPEEREALVAAVTTAHRARAPRGEIRPHRAFFDLDEAGRAEAFEDTLRLRALEAAADPGGLSSTARAVLARIR
jgi:hypothetical protein